MGESAPAAPWKPPTMAGVGSSPSPGGAPPAALQEADDDDEDDDDEEEEEEEEEVRACVRACDKSGCWGGLVFISFCCARTYCM